MTHDCTLFIGERKRCLGTTRSAEATSANRNPLHRAYAEQNFEAFLKAWKADKATRHPVSGVGDRAFIMFPVPESRYKDRAAYLVAHVGQQIVTVALFAHDGQSESSLAEHCRKNESKLRPNEKTDCARVLADKSETQESLQPAVVDLAKIVVAKVRSGKGP